MSVTVGVHHVALDVADTEESVRFYADVMGFTQIERPDFGFPGAWFDINGTQLHLLEVAGYEAVGFHHFALQVDDVDALAAELTAKGIDVSPPASSFTGAGRQSFIKDPSGNVIELNQPDPVG